MQVLITHEIPANAARLLREAGHEVTLGLAETSTEAELRDAVAHYDAILCLLTDQFSARVLEAAGKQLKIIANYAVGYDNIDVPAAREKGIAVTNTPDVLTPAVAEHTITLLAALARRIVEADRFTRSGKFTGWQAMLLLGTELQDKVLGIVGLGRIGTEVGTRARGGFGMRIAYHDLAPNADFEARTEATFYDSLEKLLPAVDAVTLHVPLVPATKHLVNASRLASLKPTALLVNTSRGPVIDEAALVAALQAKRLGGAALDVFEYEPQLAAGLAALDNVILTPHIASATIEARGAMAELAARNIVAVLSGRPPETPVPAP